MKDYDVTINGETYTTVADPNKHLTGKTEGHQIIADYGVFKMGRTPDTTKGPGNIDYQIEDTKIILNWTSPQQTNLQDLLDLLQ